jgi:hypothetical protein
MGSLEFGWGMVFIPLYVYCDDGERGRYGKFILHTRGIQYELEEDRRTLGHTRSVEVSTMNVEDAGSITIPMPTFYALACKT